MENGNQNKMKIVYTVVERGERGKSFWVRVGVGFVNQDGSINLKLDAVPVNGTLQVRDWEPKDAYGREEASSSTRSRTNKREAAADTLL